MKPHLRLDSGQQVLTPAQEAEAHRFAAARIQAQLSMEPADEHEAETLLRRTYEEALGLAAPQRIHWVDGPLQLVEVVVTGNLGESVEAHAQRRDEGHLRA